MTDAGVLARLAAELVDGRSLDPCGGAPWAMIAAELDHLHAHGRTLADLANAVRADLTQDFPEPAGAVVVSKKSLG